MCLLNIPFQIFQILFNESLLLRLSFLLEFSEWLWGFVLI